MKPKLFALRLAKLVLWLPSKLFWWPAAWDARLDTAIQNEEGPSR